VLTGFIRALRAIDGAYSLVALSRRKMIGLRATARPLRPVSGQIVDCLVLDVRKPARWTLSEPPMSAISNRATTYR